jgi:branched-chain amino acid aminotransferase
METTELIWQNGEFVPWDDAKTHVLSHGLHYGTGVFEGIRCYETERGPAVFRHREHLEPARESAELYYLELPYSAEEIREATNELIRRNGLGPATSARSPTAATADSASTRPTPDRGDRRRLPLGGLPG